MDNSGRWIVIIKDNGIKLITVGGGGSKEGNAYNYLIEVSTKVQHLVWWNV